MEQTQLQDVMKFHLTSFNNENELIDDDLVHEKVLSERDGIGEVNSKNLYNGVIRWTLKHQGLEDKPWPNNWMSLTVKELASKLLLILVIMLSATAGFSQLRVDVSSVKTQNKNNAIEIGLTYVRQLDSMFQLQNILLARSNSLFALSPQFEIRTGTSDAFSSITAKLSGFIMTFDKTTISGIETPNTAKPFNTFPLSVGVETNNLFTTINALAEVGWVPWYQQPYSTKIPEWLRATRFGVFLQAGYKFSWDSAFVTGGQKDESLEVPNSAIFRVKGSASINMKTPVTISGMKTGVTGAADVWYDMANGAFYYKYNAIVRTFIAGDKYLDLIYQKGSGAPNFNQGDQYGIGLTITF